MKIQIFSDLHADVHPIKPITVVDDIHAVIVAGDTVEIE
jgi:predicted phosphodiesterase